MAKKNLVASLLQQTLLSEGRSKDRQLKWRGFKFRGLAVKIEDLGCMVWPVIVQQGLMAPLSTLQGIGVIFRRWGLGFLAAQVTRPESQVAPCIASKGTQNSRTDFNGAIRDMKIHFQRIQLNFKLR